MKAINQLVSTIITSHNDKRSLIPRLVVGLVFLSEGIQKFLFPELVGVGRFEKIGFANPEILAYLVAYFEVTSGAMILAGLLTRLASIPLLTIMATAIVTTKIPILLNNGFWKMAHDSRTDFAMTMLLVYLIIYGAGSLSVDKLILSKKKQYIKHH
ncbi:DoxX family membrane protein [Perlabentimonas gracilis]|uniref:DoxX family membrane protein n=1 Tax=Perlabentimonas gracilis TaxID=2715279 RepID=UPI00140CCF1C|nr:DoxX family membrane protein [Perlabentimonas gracilis]NHB69441.1 DoxX family membrane protein [Perlabentimonas gracilis]